MFTHRLIHSFWGYVTDRERRDYSLGIPSGGHPERAALFVVAHQHREVIAGEQYFPAIKGRSLPSALDFDMIALVANLGAIRPRHPAATGNRASRAPSLAGAFVVGGNHAKASHASQSVERGLSGAWPHRTARRWLKRDDGQPVPALTIRPLGIVFPGRLKKILPVRDHSYAALAGWRMAAIRSSSN